MVEKDKNGAGEGKWTEGLPIHLDGWLPRNCQVGGAGKYLSSAALAMVFE